MPPRVPSGSVARRPVGTTLVALPQNTNCNSYWFGALSAIVLLSDATGREERLNKARPPLRRVGLLAVTCRRHSNQGAPHGAQVALHRASVSSKTRLNRARFCKKRGQPPVLPKAASEEPVHGLPADDAGTPYINPPTAALNIMRSLYSMLRNK